MLEGGEEQKEEIGMLFCETPKWLSVMAKEELEESVKDLGMKKEQEVQSLGAEVGEETENYHLPLNHF